MALARFLHTADLHLSRPFGILPPPLAEERRRDQRRTLVKIADIAIERSVDLVLIAGDLFDSPDPDPTDLEAVTQEFSRLADAGKLIFVLPGNHDYATSNNFWSHFKTDRLHIFKEFEWETVALDNLGISISGIAFQRNKSERRAFDGLETTETPSIVMVHASYEMFEGQLEKYHPFSSTDLAATGAAYVALGHYHRFNAISENGTTACYPGTPEGLGFDSVETGDRFVVVGEMSDDGSVSIEPIKVNRHAMKSEELDCTTFESQVTLLDAVRSLCDTNTLLELRLTGLRRSEIDCSPDELPERFKESCYYMTINSSGLSLPADMPTNDHTIRGRFCRHLLKQIEGSSDPERQRLLQRALELGLAAFAEK